MVRVLRCNSLESYSLTFCYYYKCCDLSIRQSNYTDEFGAVFELYYGGYVPKRPSVIFKVPGECFFGFEKCPLDLLQKHTSYKLRVLVALIWNTGRFSELSGQFFPRDILREICSFL